MVASFLSIRGGGPLFFGVVSLAGLFWLLPRLGDAVRGLRKPKSAEAVAAAVLLACMIPGNSQAAETPPLKPAESMIHDWQIRDGRLFGTVDDWVADQSPCSVLLCRQYERAGVSWLRRQVKHIEREYERDPA